MPVRRTGAYRHKNALHTYKIITIIFSFVLVVTRSQLKTYKSVVIKIHVAQSNIIMIA